MVDIISDEEAEKIIEFFDQSPIPPVPNNVPHASIVPVENRQIETRSVKFADLVQAVMNEAQFNILCGKTPDHAKRQLTKGGTQFDYLPHGYTRDQLNKAFGFDYDFEMLPLFGGMPFYLTERSENGKTVQYVTVAGRLTIRIRNPQDITQVVTTIVKTEFGSQAWRASMEFGDALKGASSDALKRCGVSLGVGLDLYYDDDKQKEKYDNYQELRNSVNGNNPAKDAVVKLHQEKPELKAIQIVTELKSRGVTVTVPQVTQWISG